jgi:ABC-2 type transport system permease protein
MTIYHFNEISGLDKQEIIRQYDQSVMQFFLKALARKDVFVQSEGPESLNLTPAEYFTAALLVVFIMFSGMPALKMLVAERNSGVLARLASSRAGMFRVVLSKLIASTVLASLQALVVITATALLFRNYWAAPVKSILLLYGAIIFAVSAWSVLVSSISMTSSAADALGNLGILLMAVIGGSIYPLSSMPGPIRELSLFTINRWAMEGFMILFSGNESLSVIKNAGVLAAMGLVMFGAASLIITRTANRQWQ